MKTMYIALAVSSIVCSIILGLAGAVYFGNKAIGQKVDNREKINSLIKESDRQVRLYKISGNETCIELAKDYLRQAKILNEE